MKDIFVLVNKYYIFVFYNIFKLIQIFLLNEIYLFTDKFSVS